MEARGLVQRKDVRFFGPENRGERSLMDGSGVAFVPVPAGAVRGRGPLALLRSAGRIGWGTLVALRRLRSFAPDVVFSTGGYASFPASVAARILRRPLVVFLPDVRPGWAVRAESRLATRMATTAEAAVSHLPEKKTAVTGYPVRKAFFDANREAARATLGVRPGELLLLVAGASQGAQAINGAVFRGLRTFVTTMKVVHVTGPTDYDEAAGYESQLGAELAGRYFPAPFRHDLPTVMVAADLAVMRAGASTLGELTAAGLPAILVPGTYAGGHQRDNAEWLAAQGAAVVLAEADLHRLPDLVRELADDEARLPAMRACAAKLARPGAADAIADIVVEAARR
jgi:UDP-N-acetylglucosamine--N-acetylmuramyl-(pentapeptide) pyrophosphoryl-undecaprenol N-acetylglucosamine transferase